MSCPLGQRTPAENPPKPKKQAGLVSIWERPFQPLGSAPFNNQVGQFQPRLLHEFFFCRLRVICGVRHIPSFPADPNVGLGALSCKGSVFFGWYWYPLSAVRGPVKLRQRWILTPSRDDLPLCRRENVCVMPLPPPPNCSAG